MKTRLFIAAIVSALALSTCGSEQEIPNSIADIIFLGENIVTMDDTTVEAVAVIGDRIAASGGREEILSMQADSTRLVELGEHALLPGFIDAHGHFSAVARNSVLLDLSSPPVGTVSQISDIVAMLRSFIEEQQIGPEEWVFAYGYDDSLLAENRHPNRDDLDQASTTNPIVVRHVSGHLLAANSVALEARNVNRGTFNPEGGIIRRRPGTNEPDGVMEETAMGLFPSSSSSISDARQFELLRDAIDLYASYGITTIQDSNVGLGYVERMRQEAETNPFQIDIVTYVMANGLSDDQLTAVTHDSEYRDGYRVGGVKFTLDGSPQGRTAWMSQPYSEGPPGVDADYVAYPSYDPEAYKRRMIGLLDRGTPVLAHANGDAAIELMIDGVAGALDGNNIPDHRSIAIHAQLVRDDQLDRMKQLSIIPSYYAVHPFFWGDWHRLSFGEERAAFISPVKATIDREIPFTIHNDSPVVPPDIMRLVWVTVNRLTRSGFVLGPEQRASVMEALNAVTLGAAYQYFEEDQKGSITPGKLADLVILDQNPLLVDPRSLQDIAVVETLARGQTVFQR